MATFQRTQITIFFEVTPTNRAISANLSSNFIFNKITKNMKTCLTFVFLLSVGLSLSLPHHFKDQYSKNGLDIAKTLILEYDLEDIEILEKVEKNSDKLTSQEVNGARNCAFMTDAFEKALCIQNLMKLQEGKYNPKGHLQLTKEELDKERNFIEREIQFISRFSKGDTIQYFSEVYPKIELTEVLKCLSKDGEDKVQCYYDLLTQQDLNHQAVFTTLAVMSLVGVIGTITSTLVTRCL